MSQLSCGARLVAFLKTPELKLYCSYGLSTWAERLWEFALSLVLVEIGGDLRLVAINGLIDCLMVLLFASSVGRWIDGAKRLVAARTMLTLTNMTVALSVGFLLVVQYWEEEISPIWDGSVRILLIGLAILLCAISMLTAAGTKIVLTKDWVVVMSENDNDKLAEMNAMMLRIDLTAMILSPLVAGQLMTSISVVAGCLFIAAWDLCSWGIEFWLLNIVYRAVPALSIKHTQDEEKQTLENNDSDSLDLLKNAVPSSTIDVLSDRTEPAKKADSHSSNGCYGKISHALKSAADGWRSYYRQSVFPAALSMALLYMTVLGFDGITTGYAYAQGLQENELAIARGVGALIGISGTILFPWLRSRIDLVRTGLVSFAMELSCLLLSVSSIWLPGSPFDPIGYFRGDSNINHNYSILTTATSFIYTDPTTLTWNVSQVSTSTSGELQEASSQWSILIFLLGIILARCGLWMADLSVTQIMQESIAEYERGVVNGVQSSTNQLLSMVKDLLVIALPDPPTFGLLMIASWISIFIGYLSYIIYARRVRGDTLPLHKKNLIQRQYGTFVGSNEKMEIAADVKADARTVDDEFVSHPDNARISCGT